MSLVEFLYVSDRLRLLFVFVIVGVCKTNAIQPFVIDSDLWCAIFCEVVAEGAAFDAGHGRWGLAAEVVVDFGGGV